MTRNRYLITRLNSLRPAIYPLRTTADVRTARGGRGSGSDRIERVTGLMGSLFWIRRKKFLFWGRFEKRKGRDGDYFGGFYVVSNAGGRRGMAEER
eukprot:1343269-Amorphochlora_amoeboformis.AAC.2